MADLNPNKRVITVSLVVVGFYMFEQASSWRWGRERMGLPDLLGSQWPVAFDTFLEERKPMESY